MYQIRILAQLTVTGLRRDKAFCAIVAVGIIFFMLAIPTVSILSMRQVREVAVSMALSGISFISVILAVVFGVNTLYRDIERKFIHHALSLPISRNAYVIGRFVGLAAVLAASLCILTVCASLGISLATEIGTSDRPMLWSSFFIAIFSEYLKILVTLGFAFLFSIFSSSIFVPLFATVSVYLAGNTTQAVVEYLRSSYGANNTSPIVSTLAQFAYYILPNFSAFDLKFRAIYALPISLGDVLLISAYAGLYITAVLSLALIVFRGKDLA